MTAKGRKTSAESDGLGQDSQTQARNIVVGIRLQIGRRMGLRGLLHTTLRQ